MSPPRPNRVRLTEPGALEILLKHHRFSYRELGERVGCSGTTIGNLATKIQATCKPDMAEALARELHVPFELLFCDARVDKKNKHDNKNSELS